ncbi:hypothetical protein [Streptomyces sp. GS7]|nr:hypothetical protein [Streptomyces sp. GS7]
MRAPMHSSPSAPPPGFGHAADAADAALLGRIGAWVAAHTG